VNAQQIVQRPLVTERSMTLRDTQNKYMFKVHPRATKPQIRKAIEELFTVKVTGVATMNVVGKPKRLGRSVGRRPAWKKAIVTVAQGQTIEIYDAV
jgi:large subunit ribosomal protein L23